MRKEMEYFVEKDSIVRKIWGNGDVILVIFAGASAEFALNKAVDWLYFTGRLPEDPLGRLFTTVSYARAIVFSGKQEAYQAIDAMTKIHGVVETRRGSVIPDWAYRDVLFMLIDYSIRSFEILEYTLSLHEKEEVFRVFREVGSRMGLKALPDTFESWVIMRQEHLAQNLENSYYTKDLYSQYRKNLGLVRYSLLKETQILIIPHKVQELLVFRDFSFLIPLLVLYKLSRNLKLDWILKWIILPRKYKKEIMDLDRAPL